MDLNFALFLWQPLILILLWILQCKNCLARACLSCAQERQALARQFLHWRIQSRMRMRGCKRNKAKFRSMYNVTYDDQHKLFIALSNPASNVHTVSLKAPVVINVVHTPLWRLVLHVAAILSKRGEWDLGVLPSNDDTVVFSLGFDAQVRNCKISLMTLACLHSANRHDPRLAMPFLSWIGDETKEYLFAVDTEVHFSAEIESVQGRLVSTPLGPRAIRFCLNCDNAAHHRFSHTSPPNFYSRSPKGLPCPWCQVLHEEIQYWHPDRAYRVTQKNHPGSLISCIPPTWRGPDWPLHGVRNYTNILWQAIVRIIKTYYSSRVADTVCNEVWDLLEEKPTKGFQLSFDGAQLFCQLRAWKLITNRLDATSEVRVKTVCGIEEEHEIPLSSFITLVFTQHLIIFNSTTAEQVGVSQRVAVKKACQ